MSRKILEEFIEIYQNEECLWKVKCKEYHNRDMKNAAYDKLVQKLRETIPEADRDTVVKKINNIRSSYRKEFKKVQASKRSGASSNDVYCPKLWYFQNLAFLQDQEIPQEDVSIIEGYESQVGYVVCTIYTCSYFYNCNTQNSHIEIANISSK